MSISNRIRQLRESNNYNKSEFSSILEIDNSQYSKIESGKVLPTVNLLIKLSSLFNVQIDWILKGDETNFKEHSQLNEVFAEPKTEYNEKKGIPLLPVDAFGGSFNGGVQVLSHETESYIVPLFSGADFLIPVKGNSMYPKYNSGDLVACKRIESWSFFQWGKVYVISTDQGVLIKRVMEATDEESILLVSEQKDLYPAHELKKSDIHDLGIVLGVIKTE